MGAGGPSTVKSRRELAMSAGALLALGLLGSCEKAGEASSHPNAGGGSTSAGPVTETPCSYVEATPTYLPWLAEGEEVPEPQRWVKNGASYVGWSSGGDDPVKQRSLVFRRNTEPLGGEGEAVSVRLEGAEGYYYSAPGSLASALWKTDSGSCGLITLALSLPGSDRAELRDHILKVVESLEVPGD